MSSPQAGLAEGAPGDIQPIAETRAELLREEMSVPSGRVVITGLGAVTALGLDVPSTWAAAVAGKSGAGPITLFDATDFDTRIACEVKDWDPTVYLDRKEVRRTDRVVQFAIGASLQALKDAAFEITPENAQDVGVLVGTGVGGIATLSEQLRVLI